MSRRTSIAALTAAVASLVLAACGGSSSSSTTGSGSGSSQGTVDSTTSTAHGNALSAGGVSITLPSGWRDGSSLSGTVASITSSLGLSGGSDALILAVGPVVDGFARNINIRDGGAVSDVTQIESGFAQLRSQLETSALHATQVTDPTRLTIAGEGAEKWTALASPTGTQYAIVQLLVAHNGKGYICTYSSAVADSSAAQVDLTAIIEGWTWS